MPYVLGVSRLLSTTSPAWERTDDSVGLVAEANKHTTIPTTFTPARDDFAMSVHGGSLYFYKDIDIVNMRVSDGAIVAKLSDPDSGFVWTGTRLNSEGVSEAVDVMTYYPGHYIKRWQDTAEEAGGEANRREHIQLSMWNFDGAMYVEPYYRGTFEAYYTGGKLRSYAGVTPKSNTSIESFRTYASNNPNNKMSIGDWRDFDFLCLYLIKYANYDSQTMVGNGIVNLSGRQITGYGGAHITLNGRDGYIGTNQKTSVWCLGLCNPWGNVQEFVDGITINSNQACVATNPNDYKNSATSSTPGYTNLGYPNWDGNGWPGKVGCDYNAENPTNQLISFPTAGGSASTGICDYYYQDSDVCMVLRGGRYDNTTRAGAFCLRCSYAFIATYVDVGCQLLKEVK